MSQQGARLAWVIGAVVLAVVATLTAVESGDSDEAGGGPSRPPVEQPDAAAETAIVSVDPYGGGCSDPLPPLPAERVILPDLDDVRSVRLCVDPAIAPARASAPRRTLVHAAAPFDAVVDGFVTEFAAGVAAGRPFDDKTCAAYDRPIYRTSLELELPDGTLLLAPTDPCVDVVTGDGQVVAGSALAEAFLPALDTQRAEALYPLLDRSLPPLTCDSVPTQAPVRPDGDIAGGVRWCPGFQDPDHDPVPLTYEQKRALEVALSRAPTPEPGEERRSDEEMPYLVFRTNLDDLVRLYPTDGGLLLDTWRAGFDDNPTAVVPIGLDDLS